MTKWQSRITEDCLMTANRLTTRVHNRPFTLLQETFSNMQKLTSISLYLRSNKACSIVWCPTSVQSRNRYPSTRVVRYSTIRNKLIKHHLVSRSPCCSYSTPIWNLSRAQLISKWAWLSSRLAWGRSKPSRGLTCSSVPLLPLLQLYSVYTISITLHVASII